MKRSIIPVEPTEDVLFDEKLMAEYEDLLIRRDQVYRDAGSYLVAYTQEFGDLINESFELKIACIKKKKTISYCRRRMNRGLNIDTDKMQEEIDKEMTLYNEQLQEMLRRTEEAKNSKPVGDYRFNRAKKIYRRLAKILHPDINCRTMQDQRLRELWEQITEAYRKSDVEALEDLEVLVRKAMDEMGDEGFELDPFDLEGRIERVEGQINDTLTTEPYIYGEILRDEEKKQARRDELLAEKEDYKEYLEALTKTLEEMLQEGGVRLVWTMN